MITLPNQQPISPPEYNQDGILKVLDVWPTIQGEGPDAGTPAVFVRLMGCNLQCPMCDTDYTGHNYDEAAMKAGRLARGGAIGPGPLADMIEKGAKQNNITLVVLTGGEPFRQNIQPLVSRLLDFGLNVQIETNGTLYVPGDWAFDAVSIVCSPKARMIHASLRPKITAYKYVLEAGKIDDDGLPTSILGNNIRPARPPADIPRTRIFVQPLDVGEVMPGEGDIDDLEAEAIAANQQNIRATVESARTFGYRISLQLHKLLGLE